MMKEMQYINRFNTWRGVHFLLADQGLATLFAGGVYLLSQMQPSLIPPIEERVLLYCALSVLFGVVFGFMLVGTAILLEYAHNEALLYIRASRHYQALWRTCTTTIRWLILAMGATLLAGVFAVASGVQLALVLFIICTTIVRVLRSVWLFERIVALVARKSTITLDRAPPSVFSTRKEEA